MITGNFQKSSKFLYQQPWWVSIRNRDCFCEGKEVNENFLQESTGTDKVKTDNRASCLVATRYTCECNRDKVNLLLL